jgi:hypothetical protein
MRGRRGSGRRTLGSGGRRWGVRGCGPRGIRRAVLLLSTREGKRSSDAGRQGDSPGNYDVTKGGVGGGEGWDVNDEHGEIGVRDGVFDGTTQIGEVCLEMEGRGRRWETEEGTNSPGHAQGFTGRDRGAALNPRENHATLLLTRWVSDSFKRLNVGRRERDEEGYEGREICERDDSIDGVGRDDGDDMLERNCDGCHL